MSDPGSSATGPATGRFGEVLLSSLTSVLETETPTDAMESAPGLFAAVSAGVASVFSLRPDGSVIEEFWSSVPDVLRSGLTREFHEAVADAREAGASVTRSVSPGGGTLHVWARTYSAGDVPIGGICVAAPRSTPLGSPPDWSVMDMLVDVFAAKLLAERELATARAEQEQQERYFKTLDRQLRVLDRERQKFVAVVNQSDTYTVVVDTDYVVVWTNAATAERLARHGGPSGWLGRPLTDAWDAMGLRGPDPGSDRCPVARALAANEVVHEEFQLVGGTGTRSTLYLTALPVIGPDGRPDEALVLIQDLSNLNALRRSELRYRHLFERSPDAMLMVEPETWKIVLANPEASRLTGRPPEELVGFPVRSLHDAADWTEAWQEYTSAFSCEGTVASERVLRTSAGDEIIVSMSATRFDLDGQPVALVEFQDVTDKRRLENELRHRQKMEAIGRLAGGVAHDFNNLLSVIQGQSELLITKLSDPALCRTAESVRKAAVRGSLLTRQLLAFSRKDVLKPEVLDVRDIVAGIEAMLASLVGASVELHLSLADRPCRIEADRSQLEQVMMNLAVNSRDAMRDGGNLWIRVERADLPEPAGEYAGTEEPTHRVLVSVRDDGVGMDEPTRNRLFEPFFTTKEQGRGTGLGLSSSYGIVEECGGTIEVESAPGEGATFFIHFPRVRVATTSGVREVSLRTDFPVGSETVLLVEDEGDVRAMAVEVLEMMGYRVLQAASGPAALEILRGEEPMIDLLLTDVVMPGMTGGALVQEALPIRPDLRVIYMSGYTADDAMVQQGVSLSEAAFLQKPFSLEGLARKVRDVLDGSPALESGARHDTPPA